MAPKDLGVWTYSADLSADKASADECGCTTCLPISSNHAIIIIIIIIIILIILIILPARVDPVLPEHSTQLNKQ